MPEKSAMERAKWVAKVSLPLLSADPEFVREPAPALAAGPFKAVRIG